MNGAGIRLEIVEGEGRGQSAVLSGISVIGRDENCAFVIPDPTVSREHAVLSPEKDFGFVIEDMGSSSGTWVNGQRTRRAVLQDGDRLRIGSAELRVSALRSPVSGEVPSDEVELVSEAAPHLPTTRLSLDALRFRLDTSEGARAVMAGGASPVAPAENELERLEHLVGLSLEMAEVRQPIELAQRAAQRLASMFPQARRVGIFELREADPEGQAALSPLCVLDRTRTGPGSGRIRISQTVLEHAIKQGQALLTEDLSQDPRFQDGDSPELSEPAAMMCVPLILGERPQGVLYLDTTETDSPFSEGCLRLAAAVGAILAAALGTARLFARVHDEAARRGSLERYFSQSLVDRVMAGEVKMALEGEHVEGTILFVDVRDFTRLTDVTAPEILVKTLNAYFAAMQRVIFRLEGTVERFGGDSILAYWGVVEDDPLAAARCVSAALGMLTELFFLNAEFAVQDQPELKVGVGINTGDVVAGAVGSPQRFEYTILGSAINLARRLESEAGPWELIAGAETVRALGQDVLQAPLPPRHVKGKDRPVALAAVFGLLRRDEVDPARSRARPENSRYDLALPATVDLETGLEVTLISGLEINHLGGALLEVLTKEAPTPSTPARVSFTLPRGEASFTALARVHVDLDTHATTLLDSADGPLRPVQRLLLDVDNGPDLLRFLGIRGFGL